MSKEFASANLTVGQINAIVKKMGGHEEVLRFLRGETSISDAEKKWIEENGVICIPLINDETSGHEWVSRLKSQGIRITSNAQDLLLSPSFKPTKRVFITIVVLKQSFFIDSENITKSIRTYAKEINLSIPSAEVACLSRELLCDNDLKNMGLDWIIFMHEPINDSKGNPFLFYISRVGSGSWLSVEHAELDDDVFNDKIGFAFIAS